MSFPTTPAWAWGAKGHRIVGHVADARICDSTRETISAILADESIAEAGIWADTIRGQKRWAYTKPWHYINVPDGIDPAEADRVAEGDVLSAIDDQTVELQDEVISMRAQRDALRFLIHFVADVHQPLHVGRRDDLGGNKIEVRSNLFRGKSNLHKYWDSGVLKPVAQGPQRYAEELLALAGPGLASWTPGDPLDWARESAEIRPLVYDFPPGKAGEPALLDEAYQAHALEIADQRLAQAGLRLAAQLDARFCSAKERQARREVRQEVRQEVRKGPDY